MRYPARETARKHQRILDAAGALFRSEGLSINVREIMKAADMTHGAFYSHFASKEALIGEAVERSIGETLGQVIEASGAPNPSAAILSGYLSQQHRDNQARGCTIAALGAELSRQPKDVRDGVTRAIGGVIDGMTAVLEGETTSSEARGQAIRVYALAIGALILARAVNDPDLSNEIIERARGAFGDPVA